MIWRSIAARIRLSLAGIPPPDVRVAGSYDVMRPRTTNRLQNGLSLQLVNLDRVVMNLHRRAPIGWRGWRVYRHELHPCREAVALRTGRRRTTGSPAGRSAPPAGLGVLDGPLTLLNSIPGELDVGAHGRGLLFEGWLVVVTSTT